MRTDWPKVASMAQDTSAIAAIFKFKLCVERTVDPIQLL